MSQQVPESEEEISPIFIPPDFEEPIITDEESKKAFEETVRKIEQVRHISSPILKVVFI